MIYLRPGTRMRVQTAVLWMAGTMLVACSSPDSNETPGGVPNEVEGLNVAAIADVLAERMDLQDGERVLLLAQAGRFEPLLEPLREHVQAAGATYLGAASVDGSNFGPSHATAFVESLSNLEADELAAALADVDLGIMLPGAGTDDPIYAALQQVLRTGRGRTIHFHWAGAYGLDGVLFEPDANVDTHYVSSLQNTDYEALSQIQSQFEEAMRSAPVRVTTPAGTDITFEIGSRPVTRQDGDASQARMATARNLIDREVELPAGAIRVAPVEESVEGRIVFPPGVWGGRMANGVTLTFSEGRATSVDAADGRDAVETELDEAGPAGRAFREFALGFNPTLAIPGIDPWIPYYGYGAGVVRLSLGDNTELGGNVGGGYVRWNFFTDATVMVGDEIWVEQGRLVR